jgi:hypothetical protein
MARPQAETAPPRIPYRPLSDHQAAFRVGPCRRTLAPVRRSPSGFSELAFLMLNLTCEHFHHSFFRGRAEECDSDAGAGEAWRALGDGAIPTDPIK